MAYNEQDLHRIAGPAWTPPHSEVLLEESLHRGRSTSSSHADRPTTSDRVFHRDIDPMGVHTGDSVTVAPR